MFEKLRLVVSDLNLSMKELFDYAQAAGPEDPIYMIYNRLDKRIMHLLYVSVKEIMNEECDFD